ncbi:hypothetical protein DFH07DRAFT_767661 [Mycena maculata]|uniref:CxC2-like cysteine cluster KDZ transposase-associated domain-containing protein n=1 Tax=Mycena maculata TaxID=230809 RepID=A0AAD7JXG1_9AGAR|nr:hypothetical protein DFH07DRAFT_767661 [Mycena maculata]
MTDDRPRTCTTFECLDDFQCATHQSKTMAYDYYTMLEKKTDNTGRKLPNRYHTFLLMSRKYGHLLMLKRGGRGHAPSRVEGTEPGELAVLCPCCPHPRINLPEDWENVPLDDQFLYIFFLALDACFRLKRRLVSSELKDPSLGISFAYLVESVPYRGFLRMCTDQKEMNTCSGLAALDHDNTKFSRGYSSAGVGMGVCALHEFVQPNGVRDLQKGERVVIAMQLWCFVIPKMHIHSHMLVCQLAYSLNLVPGSMQTDGEGIERPWAHIGGVAGSTWEMGLGAREDVLNGHWATGIGKNWWAERLRTRSDQAKEEYAALLNGFMSFSLLQVERVPGWGKMIQDFEADPKNARNPYELPVRGIMEAAVLLQFEEEDAACVARGVPGIHSVSPASFMAAALEVEDEQYVELKKKGTMAQQIDVMALQRVLTKNIQQLRTLQATYTPAAIIALNARPVPENEEEEPIEKEPLFLPSALTAEQRATEPLKGLTVIEDVLRDMQCSTTLQFLHRQLNVKSRLLNYKCLHARHQGPNTRARTMVQRNETKIRLHSEKYQMAWEAKRCLAGGDPSKVGWRLLMAEDVRCMEDAAELAQGADKWKAQERRRAWEAQLQDTGELLPMMEAEQAEEGEREVRGGKNVREVSWIWTVVGTAGSDADLEDALQIEWSKPYARTRRWREEDRLLVEETQRLPVFLEFYAREWERRAGQIPVSVWSAELAEGVIVYALRQAAISRVTPGVDLDLDLMGDVT